MGYEIKTRGDKYYVVDTDTKKIRGTYDNEDDAEDRKDELDFRATVRDRMSRMPVAEMTAEEKAAAYDKMMAEKNKDNDSNLPPKKDEKTNPETKTKKRGSLFWDSLGDEDD
jgi:hypothetical protein